MFDSLFDCKQLISVKAIKRPVNTVVGQYLKDEGFLTSSDVNPVASKYLCKYLHNNVIEILDDEFLGAFEEWEDKETPPLEIQKLINALENIGKIEGVEVITVILVNSFPEYINNENLLVKKGSVENLKTLLFSFSSWNLNENNEVLIVEITN